MSSPCPATDSFNFPWANTFYTRVYCILKKWLSFLSSLTPLVDRGWQLQTVWCWLLTIKCVGWRFPSLVAWATHNIVLEYNSVKHVHVLPAPMRKNLSQSNTAFTRLLNIGIPYSHTHRPSPVSVITARIAATRAASCGQINGSELNIMKAQYYRNFLLRVLRSR